MTLPLPRRVWLDASALAFVAGIVNVVGLLGFEHQAISHLTGTTSMLGAAAASHATQLGPRLLALVLAFVTGAAISSALVGSAANAAGRRHGWALLLEAALLAIAVPLFERGHFAGPLLAAAACGLQNALATLWNGMMVRTTHLTGLFTDVGTSIGHALRGIPVARRRLALCLVVIAGFFAGGWAGAWLFSELSYRTLHVAAGLAAAMGLLRIYADQSSMRSRQTAPSIDPPASTRGNE